MRKRVGGGKAVLGMLRTLSDFELSVSTKDKQCADENDSQRSNDGLHGVVWSSGLTLRFSGGPRSGPSAATGC